VVFVLQAIRDVRGSLQSCPVKLQNDKEASQNCQVKNDAIELVAKFALYFGIKQEKLRKSTGGRRCPS
jgi:hypothetical protein